jgi:hypothetical protein
MEWLLLVYKLPPEPTRLRAAIWRKLKTAGAVYLQDGVAALPAATEHVSLMRQCTRDIADMQGTAYLLTATSLSDETALVAAYNAARVAEYTELLDRCRAFHAELAKERAVKNFTFAELEENEDDIAKLEAWFARIVRRDRFSIAKQTEAEAALKACRSDLDTFESEVQGAEHSG